MRILFLTHRLPYAPNRGDRIRAYHVLRLLGRTHEVDLISLIHADQEMDHLRDLADIAASVTGVRIHPIRNAVSAALRLAGRQSLTHLLLHSPSIDRILQEHVASMPPDVVLAYCSGMARYALEPTLSRFPFVLDMVDVDSEKWKALAADSTAPKRWIYRREAVLLRDFERRAVERASATIVISERERRLLESITDTRQAVVVQNGVDVESFRSTGVAQKEPRVVFCGVFDYRPNEAGALWMIANVWPIVRGHVPGAHLTLVGMNPTRAIRALAADPSVRVTGEVPDVRPYLWDAAISIAPIWLARGIQNKVLEATAAGLPCVVTPPVFAGLPDPVRPACVVADTAHAFAEAMVMLLTEQPDCRRRIAGRADFSNLTWSAQLHPFLDVVEASRVSAQVS